MGTISPRPHLSLGGEVAAQRRVRGPCADAYFNSHSCSGALWNFQVRFGPAMVLR
jgi:hypothetical protein